MAALRLVASTVRPRSRRADIEATIARIVDNWPADVDAEALYSKPGRQMTPRECGLYFQMIALERLLQERAELAERPALRLVQEVA